MSHVSKNAYFLEQKLKMPGWHVFFPFVTNKNLSAFSPIPGCPWLLRPCGRSGRGPYQRLRRRKSQSVGDTYSLPKALWFNFQHKVEKESIKKPGFVFSFLLLKRCSSLLSFHRFDLKSSIVIFSKSASFVLLKRYRVSSFPYVQQLCDFLLVFFILHCYDIFPRSRLRQVCISSFFEVLYFFFLPRIPDRGDVGGSVGPGIFNY